MTTAQVFPLVLKAREDRDREIRALGPRPPWWRALARVTWNAAHRAICERHRDRTDAIVLAAGAVRLG